jgi:hypothetical protein
VRATPVVVLAAAAIVAAMAAADALYMGALSNACGSSAAQSFSSPDGRHRAVLFERDCGATTGVTSQVSVVAADEDLADAPGNTFVADLKGNGPAGQWGGPVVKIRWLANTALEIRYHHTARTFVKAASAGTIQIRYVVD